MEQKINIAGLIIKGHVDKASIDKEKRIFSGWGSAEIIDRQGDYIPINELKTVMTTLMERGAPVVDSHSNHQVGRLLDYRFKPQKTGEMGLYLTAEIFSHYPSDNETWQKIVEGEYTGFSLGGKAGTKELQCNNIGCYNLLGQIEAWEFSIVERPANQLAVIDKVNKLAKSDDIPEITIAKVLGQKVYKANGYVIQKPFAGYKDFADCVSRNKDKGDAKAYCGSIYWKVEGKKKSDDIVDEIIKAVLKSGTDVQAITTIDKYTPPPSGDLSERGKQILSEVYSSCRDKSTDKAKCAKIAWHAVNQALDKEAITAKDYSLDDAKALGEKLGVDWNTTNIKEFLEGLNIELEHGTKNPELNVTSDNDLKTAKIALAHLKELPDYYTRLKNMEKVNKFQVNI